MISLLIWTVFGALSGYIARWLHPTQVVPPGLLPTITVGIIGSLVGGAIWSLFTASHYHPAGFVLSVAFAALFLWGYSRYVAR